jgi:hypothetical protein
VLFVDVSEIEVKICDPGLTGIAHGFHIFDDCRTGERQATQLSSTKTVKGSTNQSMLLPEPATNKGCYWWRQAAEWNRGARFP